jgi:hypothetical protein
MRSLRKCFISAAYGENLNTLQAVLILLFVAENVSIPSELFGHTTFNTDLTDSNLLAFQLDVFLESLESHGRAKRTVSFPPSTMPNDVPPPHLFGSALEQSVAAAITRSGGRITIPSPLSNERTPDLLMWLPDRIETCSTHLPSRC